MAVGGVTVGRLFVARSRPLRPVERILWILVLGAGFYCAGFLLRPLYGCSKGRATPTWGLYSMAMACVCTAVFHLLVDVAPARRWAAPLVHVGRNSLLAYLLHELLYPLIPLLGLDLPDSGLPGVTRTLAAATALAAAAGLAAHHRLLRLRL